MIFIGANPVRAHSSFYLEEYFAFTQTSNMFSKTIVSIFRPLGIQPSTIPIWHSKIGTITTAYGSVYCQLPLVLERKLHRSIADYGARKDETSQHLAWFLF